VGMGRIRSGDQRRRDGAVSRASGNGRRRAEGKVILVGRLYHLDASIFNSPYLIPHDFIGRVANDPYFTHHSIA